MSDAHDYICTSIDKTVLVVCFPIAISGGERSNEMEYWRTKVAPKLRKIFERDGHRKAAAADACRAFDQSQEEINREFEEKRAELALIVLRTYEASSAEIKDVVMDRTEAKIKKHPGAVNKFMEDLVKIEFPGSKQVRDASSKYGPVLVSGPVLFMLEKVATFVPVEQPAQGAAAIPPTEAGSTQEKDIVAEEEGKPAPPLASSIEPPLTLPKAVAEVK